MQTLLIGTSGKLNGPQAPKSAIKSSILLELLTTGFVVNVILKLKSKYRETVLKGMKCGRGGSPAKIIWCR
jgi:hypothetical protein